MAERITVAGISVKEAAAEFGTTHNAAIQAYKRIVKAAELARHANTKNPTQ